MRRREGREGEERLVFLDECLGFFLRLGAEGFEGPALEMADKLRRLLPMQLGRIELAEIEDLGDGFQGSVDEDADEGRTGDRRPETGVSSLPSPLI